MRGRGRQDELMLFCFSFQPLLLFQVGALKTNCMRILELETEPDIHIFAYE